MKRVLGRIRVFAIAAAVGFGSASSASAATTTQCDEKCGDTQKCKFTCCHITTKTVDGIDYVSKVTCNSSLCCAHPDQQTVGGAWHTPTHPVEGVLGTVVWELLAAELDTSTIMAEVDDKRKTVTLTGTVRSADQIKKAGRIAKKHGAGYNVANKLTVGAAAAEKNVEQKAVEGGNPEKKKPAGK